jgi:hypothetical protein
LFNFFFWHIQYFLEFREETWLKKSDPLKNFPDPQP